jgi:undecaprenyl diphosphate synthase
MDGNGRWAKQRGKSRLDGHSAGTENIRSVVEAFAEHRVKYLTLFAFSTENWGRPRTEVRGLFRILGERIQRETEALHKKGVKLCHLGRLDGLPKQLQREVRKAVELTKDNTKITLSVAFDYGSRAEILDAVRRIVEEGIPPQAINEALVSKYLYTADLPDPDLIIRTGGETRISNFLLWQSAYSELYFPPVLWPEFGKEEVERALIAYSMRERRFGELSQQK